MKSNKMKLIISILLWPIVILIFASDGQSMRVLIGMDTYNEWMFISMFMFVLSFIGIFLFLFLALFHLVKRTGKTKNILLIYSICFGVLYAACIVGLIIGFIIGADVYSSCPHCANFDFMGVGYAGYESTGYIGGLIGMSLGVVIGLIISLIIIQKKRKER